MSINPRTLKLLRDRAGMSQMALAEKSSVNRRTISRIEAGFETPTRRRQHTVESLAKALGVSCAELSKEPDNKDQRDQELRKRGYRLLKTYVDPRTVASLELVEHRYKIPVRMQVLLAPLFSTLLAEKSLARRRKRLTEARPAFQDALARLSKHLGHAQVAELDFGEACAHEEASIAAKDLFGSVILEKAYTVEPFDPDETNPFIDFIRDELALLEEQTGEEVASPSNPDAAGLPNSPAVLDEYLRREVCAGSQRACQAVQEGRVRLKDVPPELWSKDMSAERAAWLEAKYPAEEWAKQEAELRELIGTVNEATEAPEVPHA